MQQQQQTADVTEETVVQNVPQAPPVNFNPQAEAISQEEKDVLLEHVQTIGTLTLPVAVMASSIITNFRESSRILTSCAEMVMRMIKAREVINTGQCKKDEMEEYLCKEAEILNDLLNSVIANSSRTRPIQQMKKIINRLQLKEQLKKRE